jgi:hypothetical protein
VVLHFSLFTFHFSLSSATIMSPQRWQQINQLFEQALPLPLEQRADFLAQACGTDEELRREILTLLAADATPPALVEEPLGAVAANVWSEQRRIGRASR